MKCCQCPQHPQCDYCVPGWGEIAIIIEWPIRPSMERPHTVAKFACAECWEKLQRPLPGIHRPRHADEFWRPSIREHIRHSILRDKHARRVAAAPAPAEFIPVLDREHRYTAAQARSIMVLRRFK